LSGGQKVIIIYEGEGNGLAPNVVLAWKTQQAAGGYNHHNIMPCSNRLKLILNLSKNPAFILDSGTRGNEVG
jgi:hypothetical protein